MWLNGVRLELYEDRAPGWARRLGSAGQVYAHAARRTLCIGNFSGRKRRISAQARGASRSCGLSAELAYGLCLS